MNFSIVYLTLQRKCAQHLRGNQKPENGLKNLFERSVFTLNNSSPAAPRSEQQATRKIWSPTESEQKEDSNPFLKIVSLLAGSGTLATRCNFSASFCFFYPPYPLSLSLTHTRSCSVSLRHRFYLSHVKVGITKKRICSALMANNHFVFRPQCHLKLPRRVRIIIDVWIYGSAAAEHSAKAWWLL